MHELETCDNCKVLLKIISNLTTTIDQYRQLLEANNLMDFNIQNNSKNINVKIYYENDELEYMDPGVSGADVKSNNDFIIYPGKSALVTTGIYMEIPEGYECQVRPRSGLALNDSITVLNSPGTIDSSYRGECNVILINHGEYAFEIKKGMRIAQFVFQKVPKINLIKINNKNQLSPTQRGNNGCGSTGV